MTQTNRLDLTQPQADAVGRRVLRGVVYVLSGTLLGRGATPDAQFRWATTTFSGALGEFDGYLAPPAQVLRAMPFDLGSATSDPAVPIPVRNLPFAGATSLLAAIVDGNYSWEQSEASLRVGYLRPGQSPADLSADDWTFLVKDGFFGAPRDLALDGFTAILYPRGARRNQSMFQLRPLVPTGTTSILEIDERDSGRVAPVLVGRPDSFLPVPSFSVGIRGYTVSGYAATVSAQTIRVRAITNQQTMRQQTTLPTNTRWHVHTRLPIYTAATASYDPDANELTLNLASGLSSDVPRGAFVQLRHDTDPYEWILAGHQALPSGYAALSGADVGWLLPDGTVRPADPGLWSFSGGTRTDSINGNPGWDGSITVVRLGRGSNADPSIPTFMNPAAGEPAAVQDQPEFTSEVSLERDAFPTGGAGLDNGLARDGNEDTGALIDGDTADNTITLSFNDAPAPFDNTDTVESILYVVCQTGGTDTVNFFKGAGSTVLGSVTNVTARAQFRFVQASTQPYNQEVRCAVGIGHQATIYELWWHHTLNTTVSSQRTQDTVVTGGGAGSETMEYAQLVVRVPHAGDNSILRKALFNGNLINQSFSTLDADLSPGVDKRPTPTAILAGLAGFFLGSEGDLNFVDSASYEAARDRLEAESIRLGFWLTEQPDGWQQLEDAVAAQSRLHTFYGPSGHAALFMEVASALAAEPPLQEFRLPGVPGTNVFDPAGPIMERTGASEIRNAVDVRFSADYLRGGLQTREVISGQDAASIAVYGERRDPQALEFWMHSAWPGHPTYNVSGAISGLADFFAGRFAFPQTRFAVDTAWIAHGLDRGSVARAIFPVADGEYRTVACEVEEVRASPINSERFSVTMRTVEAPVSGIVEFVPASGDTAFTWAQLFSAAEVWTDEIAPGESWADNWEG